MQYNNYNYAKNRQCKLSNLIEQLSSIQVFIDMPFYGLPDDEAIEGTITGSFTNDKPVYGNATITLYVKQPWTLPDSEFKLVDSQYFEYVSSRLC